LLQKLKRWKTKNDKKDFLKRAKKLGHLLKGALKID
jgi:hypothetical protein